jgi:hypothetical protein
MTMQLVLTLNSVRGNLVHKLNGDNPTRALLDCIEQQKRISPQMAEAEFLTKEDEFFIGIPFSLEAVNEDTAGGITESRLRANVVRGFNVYIG